MAAKGQLKRPEDFSKALARAVKLFEKTEEVIAFFFIGGKLVSTHKSNPDFDQRVKQFESALVGVYEPTVDFRFIYDDLQEYYEMFKRAPVKKEVAKKEVEVPVFRSSGRRQK